MNALLPLTEVGLFLLEGFRMKMYEANVEQLELLMVKEEEKRVGIVSLRMVKETSLLYKIGQYGVQKMATTCSSSF